MVEEFDGRFKRLRFSPWKRGRPECFGSCSTVVNGIDGFFDSSIYRNMDLSIEVKRAALKVSRSVVSVVSYTIGDDGVETRAFCGCGTIVDSEFTDGKYVSTILTSASVKRSSGDFPRERERNRSNDSAEEVEITKIHVRIADDTLFEARMLCYDMHFNIALLHIESVEAIPKCILRPLDDSFSVDPTESTHLLPHSDLFSIYPGDLVIAIGRFWEGSNLMTAPGNFSIDFCESLDCQELYRADCQITKCGVGGPLINRYGEVIGLNFYDPFYTPFLPINIVYKYMEHFKTDRKFPHPQLGMMFSNLYASTVDKLERITREFPNVRKGVIIEKVTNDSDADQAGLLIDDVIIAINGNSISSVLKLLEHLLDQCGETVEFTIVRSSHGQLKISMYIDESEELNRWPLPERFTMTVNRTRC